MQLRRWQERFSDAPPLTINVNVSAKQFSDPDLVSTVRRALQETGVEGSNLCLELTESAAMEEPNRTSRILQELQHLGVRLSIDDFGTGFSSLDAVAPAFLPYPQGRPLLYRPHGRGRTQPENR